MDETPSSRGRRGIQRHPFRTAAAGLLLVVVLVCGLQFEQYTGAPAAGQDCSLRAGAVPTSGTAPATRSGPTGRAAASPAQLRKVAEGYPRWITQVRGTVNDASCLNTTPVYG
jgi:hypothetical protein